MALVDEIRTLPANPFFRHEFHRPGRQRWMAALAAANGLFVALFVLALAFSFGRPQSPAAPAVSAGFNFLPWWLAGALLLSLCAHWLVPPSVLPLLRHDYELNPLVLLVRGRHTEDEALRGQVAAGLAPLVLGAAPLLISLPLLTLYSPQHVPLAALGLAGAGLWAVLAAGVSMWSGVLYHPQARAAACAYALTSLALPLLIGGVTVAVARGCSVGHANQEVAFNIAATLTWAILVTGCAATFWDATYGRLFPHKRRPLWVDTGESLNPEP